MAQIFPRISVLILVLFFWENSALCKSAKDENHSIPLYFETKDATVVLPPPELQYDLTGNQSQSLKIGNVVIDKNSFGVFYRPILKLAPAMNIVQDKSELMQNALIFLWPEALMKTATVEVISREGKTIWRHEITQAKIEAWKKKQEAWMALLKNKNLNEEESILNPLLRAQYGIVGTTPAGLKLENKQYFRFCLTQTEGKAQSRFCTRKMGTRGMGSQLIMGQMKGQIPPRVLLQNEEAPLVQTLVTSLDFPTSFYADLANGESYEFIVQPKNPPLMDISEATDPHFLQIVGYDIPPNQKYEILNPDRYSLLVEILGFQPTIKDPRKFWLTQVPRKDSVLYFSAEGGGLFRQRLELQSIPRKEARPYLANQTLPGTYIDGSRLHGKKHPQIKVTTDQNSVEVSPKDPTEFIWEFGAPEKGAVNRSYLTVSYGQQKFKSYYEVYRGYANELSARLSAILSTGQGLFMGELAYNHWFENLLGWDNYWIAKQRWGISAKYFKSLTQLTIDSASTKVNLDVTTLDLKYRLVPGLWTREESTGVMMSYQAVSFGNLQAPMAGAGFFWARSMPKSLDDLFNYFPLMNYPKWVDVEFIMYSMSMKSTVTLNPNFALNFHGQVLWKNNLFGEAGFGIKRYAFIDRTLNQQAELNTFYGTVGMGLKF